MRADAVSACVAVSVGMAGLSCLGLTKGRFTFALHHMPDAAELNGWEFWLNSCGILLACCPDWPLLLGIQASMLQLSSDVHTVSIASQRARTLLM